MSQFFFINQLIFFSALSPQHLEVLSEALAAPFSCALAPSVPLTHSLFFFSFAPPCCVSLCMNWFCSLSMDVWMHIWWVCHFCLPLGFYFFFNSGDFFSSFDFVIVYYTFTCFCFHGKSICCTYVWCQVHGMLVNLLELLKVVKKNKNKKKTQSLVSTFLSAANTIHFQFGITNEYFIINHCAETTLSWILHSCTMNVWDWLDDN